jgi:phasin family protein
MMTFNEQFAAQNKAQVDNFLSAIGVAAAGAEKFLELQTQAAKATFAEAAHHLKSLTEAKDVQAISEMNAKVAQPSAEKLAAYSRNIYSIVTETGANLSKLVETQVNEFNKNLVTILDQAAKNAPAGSESAIAAIKTSISVANQAYDAFSKSAKQMTETAEAAVNSTASRKKAA